MGVSLASEQAGLRLDHAGLPYSIERIWNMNKEKLEQMLLSLYDGDEVLVIQEGAIPGIFCSCCTYSYTGYANDEDPDPSPTPTPPSPPVPPPPPNDEIPPKEEEEDDEETPPGEDGNS